jgi:hypothetical protein
MADEGIQEVQFKRADGGWIFKAPSPWLIGPAAHYFVTDIQKAAIAKRLRRSKVSSIAVFAIAFVILGYVAARMPEVSLEVVWYVVLPVLVAVVVANRYLAIRPLIAGLPRSCDRITFFDQMRTGAEHTSLTRSIVLFTLSSALAVIQAVRTFSIDGNGFRVRPGVDASDVPPLTILSVVFAVLAIGYAARLVRRLTSRRARQ